MKYKGIILGTQVTRPTAHLIAEKFNAIYTEMPGIFSSNLPEIEYVFRYGNTAVQIPEHMAVRVVLFNSLKVVRLMSNKTECRRSLLDMDVRCPKIYGVEDIQFMQGQPWTPKIARPPHHSQGRNFFIVRDIESACKFLDMGYYIQKIINKRIEYRMFMFNSLIMEANEKIQIRDNADMLIRNHRRGWAFKKRTLESIKSDTRRACTAAAERTRSNWCAIDICEDQDGTPYILEMNSAPGLIERKVDKLAEKFFSTMPNFLLPFSEYENEEPRWAD